MSIKGNLLSEDLYNLLSSEINRYCYEALKIEDNKYVILFLRMCILPQEEVLAEFYWILENDDPLGSRAQI